MGEMTTKQAAERLGVNADQVKGAQDSGLLKSPLTRELVRELEAEPPEWLVKARKRQRGRLARQEALASKRAARKSAREKIEKGEKGKQSKRDQARRERTRREAEAAAKISATVPSRSRVPATVVAHLGPTNSGKTHEALAFLKERRSGVYAAPLRMLAQEAYFKLREELEDDVGLVTGEERVNEEAPVVCCTVEMAPMYGDTLVLDEVHWAEDRERGSAWTRLLAGGDYEHVRLLGAPDALPLIESAFPGVDVRLHQRLGRLEWDGVRKLKDLEEATVAVCFSRKAVLALAGEIHRLGVEVAALYGAMPPAARRAEIARFVSGEARVCVATDVIGHGLNLPCRTVLFAETSKFDGLARRALASWEVAQIAGRAGRFGLHERGHVGVLTGLPWLSPESKLVQASLEPHLELSPGVFGYRRVARGRLKPYLEDLNVGNPWDLEKALPLWERVAKQRFRSEGWLAVEPVGPLLEGLMLLKEAPGNLLSRLQVREVWTLLNAPVDAEVDGPLLLLFATALAGSRRAEAHLRGLVAEGQIQALATAELEEAERTARVAAGLRWFALACPGYVEPQAAAKLEEAAAARVAEQVRLEVQGNQYGRCPSCGRAKAPWFSLCDSCFRKDRWRDDYWDY